MARPRSDIAPRVIAAARERFLKQGVDGASLRAIARAARTSIGMVYYYFPTKDDLLLAVVEEVYGKLLADLGVALAPGVSPGASIEARLHRLYERVGSMSNTEFTVIRIVLREALISSNRLKKLFARFVREGGHVQQIAATLLEGIGSGALRGDLPPLLLVAATMSLGFMPVVARRLALGAAPELVLPTPAEMAEKLTVALLEGIGSTDRR